MGSVPQGTFNFHIGLDGTMQVKQSLRSLKADVAGLTQEWKAQSTNLKSTGQDTAAAEVKYKGLTESIKSQKLVIQQLRDDQAKLDTSTAKGTEQFAKQQKAISQAEGKLASLSAQQKRAKESMDYYKSGIADAQEQLKRISDVSGSYVKRLQAEGKQNQANSERLHGLKAEYQQMGSIYQKQTSELERVAAQSGKTSDQYYKQSIRINEMKTKMAEARGEMVKLVGQSATTNTGIARMKDVSAQTGTVVKSVFNKAKNTLIGVGLAAGTTGAALVDGAKKSSELAHRYNETFNLMTLGGEKATEATKSLAQMQKDGMVFSTRYGKSQQDIADAYQELIKRGYTGKQALGAMETELQASVASGDDFSDVITVASQTMESFGKRAANTAKMTKNTKQVVNELAYAADMTATDFHDLGKGMEYVGATAHSSKFSLSEAAGAMGLLSNYGLEADKAGTGLRKVIVSLADPGKAAAEALDDIGLSVNDLKKSNGDFKSFSDIMKLVDDHSKSLGSADKAAVFKGLFGTTGMQAGQILAQHNSELKELIGNVEKAGQKGDYVQRLAKKNGSSAQQSMAKFKESTEALQIMVSSKMLPALSDAADAMSKGLAKPENQKLIQQIADGVGNMAKGTVDFVKYLMSHKNEVKGFAIVVGSIWATGKIVGFIDKAKEALSILKLVGGTKLTNLTADTLGGYTFGGALGSAKAAGGFSQLTTAGKVTTGVAGAGVAVSAGMDIYKAFTTKDSKKKFEAAGSGIGTALGGGIGLYFGGPMGAAVGAQIGKVVGTWGGDAAKKFTTGWGAKKKPKDWLGMLGFEAHQGASGITKWWDGILKENNRQQKAMEKQEAQQSKAMQKSWNSFWRSTSKGWTGFWNGVGKSADKGAKNISKGINSFAKQAGKSWTNWLHKTESDMKKYGLVGAFVHNLNEMSKSFAEWSGKEAKQWAKSWRNFEKTAADNLSDAKDSAVDFTVKTQKNLSSFIKNFGKNWDKHWADTKKSASDSFNATKNNMSHWGTDTKNWWKSFKAFFGKSWSDHWAAARKNAGDNFDATLRKFGSWGAGVNKWWSNFSSPFVKGWNGFWTGLGRFVGAVFDGVKKDIKNAMNAIIGIINRAIGGVNWVINKFGGKKETIGKIKKLATGTGAISGTRRAITKPTVAMLNDGPEADNRELVVKSDGRSYMHSEKNVLDILTPGDEVLNATETKMLFNNAGITKFASGTGVFAWIENAIGSVADKLKMITNAVAHPIKSFEDMIGNKMKLDGIKGEIPRALGGGMKNAVTNQMQKWWQTMWNLFDDSVNGGGEGGPWAHTPGSGWSVTSGFGNRGAMAGGYSAHDGVDFSGASLVHAMHGGTVTRVGGAPAGWGGASGIGESVVVRGDDGYSVIYQELNGKYDSGAGIRVKTGDVVKTGDALATLGSSGTHVHVGVTKHPMFSIGGSSTAGWEDITQMHGTSDGSSKKSKTDKGLAALVKSQLGSGVFSWLSKFIAPLTGGNGDIAGVAGDYNPEMIKKAASAMGVSPSASYIKMLQGVIQSESGGRNIVQQIHDMNSGGNEARGILQYTPGTFGTYAVRGHKNIMNPYDQLLAFFNNSDWQNAIGWTTIWGQRKVDWLGSGPHGAPRGYANGGFAAEPSIFGEAGIEAAIPLSQVKASRGYEMLGKTAAAMAARDGMTNDAETIATADKIKELLETNNSLLQGVLTVLTSFIADGMPMEANVSIGTKKIETVLTTLISKGLAKEAQKVRRVGGAPA